nr:hypothetical protein [uncultured Merdimonas sp.]
METSEKRRSKLLEQTRSLYSDKGKIPAVHPRYGAAYHSLYEQEEAAVPKGTFGIRLLLCCFLFTFFVSLDRQDQKVMDVDSDQIQEVISQDTDTDFSWLIPD